MNEWLDLLNLQEVLTESQREVQRSSYQWAQKEIAPYLRDSYRNEDFPRALIPKLGEMGCLGPDVDAISYGLLMKELERCDSGVRSFASVQGALVMYPIKTFGSEEQKKLWLKPLSEGKKVGCFGLTEAEGGSDPGAMRTQAEDKGDHWILKGSKMWITNGDIADVCVVWAKTLEGVRGFLVPKDTEGFKAVRMKGKLSLRASVTSELYFDNVKLSKDAILPKTAGLKSALECLNQARYSILWGVVGAAEACYSEALHFAKNRILFGKSLSGFQLAQRKLAIMASKITHGQWLALRLGQLKDQGKLKPYQVSLGKQSNVQMALEVARDARDILGAHGIMDEFCTMRHLCNLETVSTYEGTNDVHLLVLGQHLTGLSAFS
jgi:glutaryl-CoA dehydrogenase